MNPETETTTPDESEAAEKQAWVSPSIKKMDIEETAFGGQANNDLDGFS